MKNFRVSAFVFALIFAAALPLIAAAAGANPASASDKCALIPDPGPCKGLFTIYYFDQKTQSCKSTFYGGCEGVAPFETIEECITACETNKNISIVTVESGKNTPYAYVTINYSKDIDSPVFSFQVNGVDTPSLQRSGGFDTEKQEASFDIPLGETGEKEITVSMTAGGKTLVARKTVQWKAAPVIELIGHFGLDEAVFKNDDIKLFISAVKKVTATLNGKELAAFITKEKAAGGELLILRPKWAAGRNTIKVNAVDRNGKNIEKKYTFFSIPAKMTVKNGSSFDLAYGEPGSKSGPFYSIECDSDKLKLGNEKEAVFPALDKDNWLTNGFSLVRKVTARKTGSAKLIIKKKPHFTMPVEIEKEISLTIVK